MLVEFFHLGRNHKGAIALVRVVLKIVLVIVLGRPVVLKWFDFGDDGAVEFTQAGHFGNELQDRHVVCVVGHIDAAAVLGTHIIALAVQAGGVVNFEKYIQNIPQTNDAVVVLQTHHFVKAGLPGTDLFIAWASRS